MSTLRAYFVSMHGEGEAHQADLYRCVDCHRLITWRKIRSGNICCAGKVTPTNPKMFEVLRLLLLPWTI